MDACPCMCLLGSKLPHAHPSSPSSPFQYILHLSGLPVFNAKSVHLQSLSPHTTASTNLLNPFLWCEAGDVQSLSCRAGRAEPALDSPGGNSGICSLALPMLLLLWILLPQHGTKISSVATADNQLARSCSYSCFWCHCCSYIYANTTANTSTITTTGELPS